MTQQYHQAHNSPSIVILRDGDGDYSVSFDGGTTSAFLTFDGIVVEELQPELMPVLHDEREVWRSGPDA